MSEENGTAVFLRHEEIYGFNISKCCFDWRILRVRILTATGLAKKDIFGTNYPYCKLSLYKSMRSSSTIGNTVQTKTLKKTLNPRWNEEFLFRVNINENRLMIELYDENRLARDDFIGVVSIHLPQLDIRTESQSTPLAPKSFKLRPKSNRSNVKGSLIIYLAYLPINVDPVSWTTSQTDTARGLFETASDVNILPDESSTSELLPEGWEEKVDQNGRVYYVDHSKKRTQWEKPIKKSVKRNSSLEYRVLDFSSLMFDPCKPPLIDNHELSSFQVDTQLPDGWEERSDINGRVYYIDHNKQKNQWEHPESKSKYTSIKNVDSSIQASEPTNINLKILAETTNNEGIPSNNLTTSSEFYATSMFLRQPQISYSDLVISENSENVSESTNLSTNCLTQNILVESRIKEEISNDLPSLSEFNAATMFLRRRQISHADVLNIERSQNDSEPVIVSTNLLDQSIPIVPRINKDQEDQILCTKEDDDEELLPGWQIAITSSGRRFFINHNDKTTTWDDPRLNRERSKSISDSHITVPSTNFTRTSSRDDLLVDLGPLPPGWEEREHIDGRIFFVDHSNKNTQWEDPRLNKFSGPAVPYSRNYKQKYDYFRSKLRAPREPIGKLDMKINRKNIFEDSFRFIYNVKKTEMLKCKLWIEFIGEKGLDYGGVQREWFFLLSREMFNPYYGLFEYSATDNYTLQINPLSGVANEDHLRYYKFIGRVAGMAVYHGRLLDGFFIRPIYKMMLGKKITLKDMESVDLEYYRSLKYILDNNPADLNLSFSVDEEHFGKMLEIDLVPNGRNKIVTQENKRQYIECIINWRFVKRVEHQISALLEGFQDIVALNTLQIFDANELELLLCGLQDINVTDWKANTNYKGEYNGNHPVIINFWKTVYTFNNELRSRLLQFVTGTSRLPMNGFVELWGSSGLQKFTIEKWGTSEQLPRAHTCFNRLDLPPYHTFDELRRKLLTAIENTEGFEGVD